MNNFFRTIIAAWGAKKLGGGCLGTIVVFIIIYYALGKCNSRAVQTTPQNHSSIQAPARTTSQVNTQVYTGEKFSCFLI